MLLIFGSGFGTTAEVAGIMGHLLRTLARCRNVTPSPGESSDGRHSLGRARLCCLYHAQRTSEALSRTYTPNNIIILVRGSEEKGGNCRNPDAFPETGKYSAPNFTNTSTRDAGHFTILQRRITYGVESFAGPLTLRFKKSRFAQTKGYAWLTT